MAAIWKQFGYNLAFYLAGLQAIETSVLEAASVDGAGPIRRFFAVVFPLLLWSRRYEWAKLVHATAGSAAAAIGLFWLSQRVLGG